MINTVSGNGPAQPGQMLQSAPPMSAYQMLAQALAPPQAGGGGGGAAGGLASGLNLNALMMMMQQQGKGGPVPSYSGATGPFGNNTPGGLRVGGQDGYSTGQLPGQ